MSPGSGALAGRGRRMLGSIDRRTLIEAGIATAGYALLAILVTWPLVTRFQSEIPAANGGGGDSSGYVWDLWFHAQAGLDLWGVSIQEAVGAPWGRSSPASVNVTLFMSLGPGFLVTKLAGPIVAYNVDVMLGLVTSALAMHLLIRWLGLGVTAAAWAGSAYMVFPYMVLRAASHIPFVQLAAFPLLLLAGIRWIERPGWGRAAWFAGAVGLAWLANPYYGLMAFVMAFVLGVIGLVRTLRRDGVRTGVQTTLQVLAAMVGLVVLPLAALFASSRGAVADGLTRDPIELVLYGARITDYLLPTVDSDLFRGIFGADTWGRWGSPGGERTAFVGYVTMALALVGIAFVLARWRSREERLRIAVVSGLALVPVLVIFSLASPYDVFGQQIDMPSSLIFDRLPYLRAYARFSAAVMAVLLVLAAIGLSSLIRSTRTQVAAISVAAIAFIAMAVELPTTTPGELPLNSGAPVLVNGVDAEDVPAWRWLRDEAPADAIVMEAPGTPNELLERYFMYGQTVHGLRIVNGSLNANEIAHRFTQEYGHPGWSGSASRLAAAGVDYVVVSPYAFQALGQPMPDPASPPAGFEVAATFPDGSAVWAVDAPPADAVLLRWDGWWDPEGVENGGVRWLHRRGVVTSLASRAGTYEVSFRARGFDPAATYQVVITGPEGERRRVRVRGEADVSVRLTLPEGRSDIDVLVPTPAPRRISDVDRRVVTIQTSPWDARLVGARSGTGDPAAIAGR